ncbi:hypothetical protein [Flexivirga oryzae]|uniref:Terminase small subunit n=1 Tax=Flexivirga oryzae TaxID=1794944 RepID=A0A839NG27_9MICO|nr:hypothetical protein [Flexivirga oryzae]MBB2894566.1 hypothetical protein [Flexivirga oryzae]
MTSKPRKPRGLGTEGARLWRDVTAEMADADLIPTSQEARYLLDACREADLAAELDEAWSQLGRPVTATGAAGQVTIHPLVTELRQHREACGRLLARVRLDVPGEEATARGSRTTSDSARRAAMTRHHGNVAGLAGR